MDLPLGNPSHLPHPQWHPNMRFQPMGGIRPFWAARCATIRSRSIRVVSTRRPRLKHHPLGAIGGTDGGRWRVGQRSARDRLAAWAGDSPNRSFARKDPAGRCHAQPVPRGQRSSTIGTRPAWERPARNAHPVGRRPSMLGSFQKPIKSTPPLAALR
jgi:hypothetical protein